MTQPFANPPPPSLPTLPGFHVNFSSVPRARVDKKEEDMKIPEDTTKIPDTSERGFLCPYTVQFAGAQRDRFPGWRHDIRQGMLAGHDLEPYPDNFTGQWDNYPQVSRLRKNLTAMSQYYNLYFVAYRGWIHVYKPNRNAKRVLGRPLAILNPFMSQTPMADITRNHINPRVTNAVNDMLVGDLGDKEILLIARDNGEVVAWYTATIAQDVEASLSAGGGVSDDEDHDPPTGRAERLPSPKHFFHDNVGMSAWGLAIHKKSRLIAVSANTHEVTVFAFALDGQDANAQFKDRPLSVTEMFNGTQGLRSRPVQPGVLQQIYVRLQDQSCDSEGHDHSSPAHRQCLKARKHAMKHMNEIGQLERRYCDRRRPWRIIIPMGPESSNLPSLSFCEDPRGYADRIAVIDITGALFVADIWSLCTRPFKVPMHNVQSPNTTANGHRMYQEVQGWNVLAITDSQLLPTRSVRSAIGLAPCKAVYRGKTNRGAWLDTSKCMADVRHDSAHEAHAIRVARYEENDFSSAHDGLYRHDVLFETRPLNVSDKVARPDFRDKEGELLAMTMVPLDGEHRPSFDDYEELADFVGPESSQSRRARLPRALTLAEFRDSRGYEPETAHFLAGVSFLRANREDVEILSLADTSQTCGVVCHNVLGDVNPGQGRGPWDMPYSKRCSMLLTIPELHMVILGSMNGRVALLTLTKPMPSNPPLGTPPKNIPERAFRVDAVLPFESEDTRKQRPYVCLLGIAVSPVPEGRATGLKLRAERQHAHGGRRWRHRGADGRRAVTAAVEAEEEEGAASPPRRWRLILHYMNHDILQYEIARRPDGAEAESEWEERAWRKEWDISRRASALARRNEEDEEKIHRPPQIHHSESDLESAVGTSQVNFAGGSKSNCPVGVHGGPPIQGLEGLDGTASDEDGSFIFETQSDDSSEGNVLNGTEHGNGGQGGITSFEPVAGQATENTAGQAFEMDNDFHYTLQAVQGTGPIDFAEGAGDAMENVNDDGGG
ncbi:hypothetical protein M406DRAFT_327327 [Cryphonectria parasitica EP155]|uniref:Uncharacterized protein n=1 Tax=Cryphonectria parasitica (strain ATCC 38755 / EP155) TaxID=660469 RepID=A0A9P4Y8W9_CRYP1|nr:uncharacterized protein M406DRAFT_327327 [Cryphonectria parasitica EP155]KAF3768916.1 hypothetical protein M406DRAFT_327327 [Cryphonectria parasitica EP155]